MDFAHLTYCMVFLFFFFQGLLRICGNRCGCPGSKARKGELMFDFSHYKKWMYLHMEVRIQVSSHFHLVF